MSDFERIERALGEVASAIASAVADGDHAGAARLASSYAALDAHARRYRRDAADSDPALIERLAVRLGPPPGRKADVAAALEDLSSHPRIRELSAAARRHPARARSREYALEVLGEIRLLALLRLRDTMSSIPSGAVSQVLAAVERTAESLGAARPYTAIRFVREVSPAPPPPDLEVIQGGGGGK